MSFARWYPSITTLRNGDKLVLGGVGVRAITTPEVFSPKSGWRQLSAIKVGQEKGEWYYPRSFLGSDGAVKLIQQNGVIYSIQTPGLGHVEDASARVSPGGYWYPTTMFAPFMVLTVRNGQKAQVVNTSEFPPRVTNAPNLNFERKWGNATVLADGRILVTGGSEVDNQLVNVVYQSEIFNPPSNTWMLGAFAAKPRLYHSATLLLPDGSVLTGGGGAPGPVKNLNAEIYYPSYLYAKDGSGSPAPRPTIVSAPTTVKLGQTFTITMGSNDQIGKFNLLRLGSATHSYNAEQRLVPVPFTQTGATVTGKLDSAPERLPPGYYMIFVFNKNDVPAVAKIISVPQAVW
jgi:hypothetical protein